ncbi:hypothetical protein [Streptomyces glaucosporus]|uniref:hypothetical protein n=1 Tax=Streptomyces glaucosporus TaxID=284044 RepID=UPI0031DB2FDD
MSCAGPTAASAFRRAEQAMATPRSRRLLRGPRCSTTRITSLVHAALKPAATPGIPPPAVHEPVSR